MGFNIRPQDLADLHKWNADLLVRCRRCGRRAVFELVSILNYFRGRGWNTSWGCVAARFVCKGTPDDPGCGSKDLSVRMHPRPKHLPPEPRMTEAEMRQQAKRDRH